MINLSCLGKPAEAIVRGHRSGLLTVAEYNNLCQCESLDDIKLNLVSRSTRHRWMSQPEHCRGLPRLFSALPCSALPRVQTATDYGAYLANEASPLHTSTIVEKCTQKLVDDWNKMRCQVSARATA